MTTSTQFAPVKWENDYLVLLDQTRLPVETIYLNLTTSEEVWASIRHLQVRGAPAIGMAAAYGLYLGVRGSEAETHAQFWNELIKQADYLGTSRPTAVNLFWALDRIKARVEKETSLSVAELKAAVLDEALAIQKEDAEVCRTIGEHLLTLLHDGMGILTHCNPGALATAAYGTATAPFYLAKERGWNLKVYADETRPVLQGARLTAYELQQAGIDVTLICDNMAAMVMSQGKVEAVIVGTDRVAANGDVANKIGTYGVAVLAKAHGIPFYVAAPLSSVDLETPTGADIPIEERPAEEITHGLGKQVAPDDIKVYNPAFDVTPAKYITAIVTETGIFKPEEIGNSKK
ncbi:methylthioribose-1-phosphate isomerase 1 [Brevibacillus reuszeri]|uniref:Methylthioribose-1-phosphate isomerase n=1 Tax=Brevibacillus reuszeri TaxID=54915 RepID=A0A0K9YLW0_9BACL|nr:S-methyl-5-thioribose-1-phosphate isomerase [Brevibacillus reuszeri]KNB69723.1 methylthioribose-1-phosphate isomerase [Brevibacillus reuszeri]MED1858064.1 S-methyl-5-thioribose-1-phosphate isomerase [Brevibacillus reuszeri]GED68944.1 methylthioribose-1-phosphate isomerase 1 [Brevibacillus reuszeri]